jgi:hypothetical protein
MMDAQALGALLQAGKSDLFRLETLDRYEVPSDGGDFRRYLAGEAAPDPARKAAWHDKLRAERERGLYRRRVYVAREPLSDYARFECEWGHAPNTALEEIRVLPFSRVPAGVELADWWMIDGRTVVLMHYDSEGRFTGAEVATPDRAGRYVAARDATWEAAEPFTAWWNAHPQYHRHLSVA